MLIGYARISTDDQNLILQTDALKNAGCKKIFSDTVSGAKVDRPGLDKLLAALRPGDCVMVWRLDRLSRSMRDLIKITSQFDRGQIGLKSLNEALDTSTSTGKLIFHFFGMLAEFERNLIRERTTAGLVAARARGRNGGRPLALDKKKRDLVVKLYTDEKHSIKDICEIGGISKPTLYKYVNQAKLLNG